MRKTTFKLSKLFASVFVAPALLISNNLNAQWSGTNPLTTTSNVNINSPGNDAVLDVGGAGDYATVQITSPIIASGSYIAPFRMRSTHGPIFGPHTYSPLFCVTGMGFVGLKTETPSEMLHLNEGNILVDNGNITIKDNLGINQFRVESNGFLIAKQIDVHLYPIPDYVFHAAFNKDSAKLYAINGKYKFMSLYDVENFVKENNHLPGVKSAVEYNNIGTLNIGELNIKLLEKVEELTLHTISQQKEIDDLKRRIDKIESNSVASNQAPFKNHATNGVLIATFAIFAIIINRGAFSKLIKK